MLIDAPGTPPAGSKGAEECAIIKLIILNSAKTLEHICVTLGDEDAGNLMDYQEMTTVADHPTSNVSLFNHGMFGRLRYLELLFSNGLIDVNKFPHLPAITGLVLTSRVIKSIDALANLPTIGRLIRYHLNLDLRSLPHLPQLTQSNLNYGSINL